MPCAINEYLSGSKVRCCLKGDFCYSNVQRLDHLAIEESDANRQELVALGWTDRRCQNQTINCLSDAGDS